MACCDRPATATPREQSMWLLTGCCDAWPYLTNPTSRREATGDRPAVAPPWHQSMWLTDRRFACEQVTDDRRFACEQVTDRPPRGVATIVRCATRGNPSSQSQRSQPGRAAPGGPSPRTIRRIVERA
jgi:hypothetical protein